MVMVSNGRGFSYELYFPVKYSCLYGKKENVWFTALLLCKFALITHAATMSVYCVSINAPNPRTAKLHRDKFVG